MGMPLPISASERPLGTGMSAVSAEPPKARRSMATTSWPAAPRACATRRVIWLGFTCNTLMVAAIWLGGQLPAAPFWKGDLAYEEILGHTPRIVAASFVAYLVGEFANSFVLAKLKLATRGRWLWMRTIGSTVVGQALDSGVFVTLAFAGTVPTAVLGQIVGGQWVFKVLYEAAATPLTYAAVAWLKAREGVDVYDSDTDFNPVRL